MGNSSNNNRYLAQSARNLAVAFPSVSHTCHVTWKAAFKTNRGLYKLTVMFFGMCNSPATFQAMMDNIFEDLIEEGIVIIYMDDMFLSAKQRNN